MNSLEAIIKQPNPTFLLYNLKGIDWIWNDLAIKNQRDLLYIFNISKEYKIQWDGKNRCSYWEGV